MKTITAQATQKLTRNQTLVLGALAHAHKPLSAYDILDLVRSEGIRSPLQVYRALGPLVEHGRVHRLESLSAFVACAQFQESAHDHPHALIAFAICDGCGRVEEFPDTVIAARLKGWSDDHGFRTAKTTIEMRGSCADCLAAV